MKNYVQVLGLILILIFAPFSLTYSAFAEEENQDPVAVDDLYVTFVDATLHAHVEIGVLSNDYDPDGDTLTAVLEDAPKKGTISINSDGSFTYTSDPGFSGEDEFTYAITDGEDYDVGNVVISVKTTNPEDYVNELIDEINELVDQGILDKKFADGIIKKLQSAVTHLEQDKYTSSIGKLNATINAINAGINSHKIDPTEGQALIDRIQQIIDFIKSL